MFASGDRDLEVALPEAALLQIEVNRAERLRFVNERNADRVGEVQQDGCRCRRPVGRSLR